MSRKFHKIRIRVGQGFYGAKKPLVFATQIDFMALKSLWYLQVMSNVRKRQLPCRRKLAL